MVKYNTQMYRIHEFNLLTIPSLVKYLRRKKCASENGCAKKGCDLFKFFLRPFEFKHLSSIFIIFPFILAFQVLCAHLCAPLCCLHTKLTNQNQNQLIKMSFFWDIADDDILHHSRRQSNPWLAIGSLRATRQWKKKRQEWFWLGGLKSLLIAHDCLREASIVKELYTQKQWLCCWKSPITAFAVTMNLINLKWGGFQDSVANKINRISRLYFCCIFREFSVVLCFCVTRVTSHPISTNSSHKSRGWLQSQVTQALWVHAYWIDSGWRWKESMRTGLTPGDARKSLGIARKSPGVPEWVRLLMRSDLNILSHDMGYAVGLI